MTPDEYLDYVAELEKYHKGLNFEIPPSKWAEIAPEMKTNVSEMLLNRYAELQEIKNKIKADLSEVKNMSEDRQMWREAFLETSLGLQAVKLQNEISWLERYLAHFVEDKPTIGDAEIERAKTVPLADLIPGLKLKSGKLVCCCPFHQEKTPSFTVFKNNHYHCFGCGANGDNINFVMETQKLDFISAVKYLLKL